MPSSHQTLRERRCRITVYGPTVPMGTGDRAACLVQALPRGNDPDCLHYQPAAHGVRAYTLYRDGDNPRWLDVGPGSRVYLSPSLFVVDAEGATRAIPLASDRWAVSADGSRAAFAFGYHDHDDHEFTPSWGYVNCKVDLWDVPAAARVASAELEEMVPVAVAFAGENVLIDCRYEGRRVWEPGGSLRGPTSDESGIPVPGSARVERKLDWSDFRMALPGGGGARIPLFLPPVGAALPAAGGRLFLTGYSRCEDWSLEYLPIWLDDRGSAPVRAAPDEWTTMMGVDMATIPLVWSPSAACFVTGLEEERRIVERGTGRTLYTPPSGWVSAITDDGARAVMSFEGFRNAVVSRGGEAIPLKTDKHSKFAFSRAGDRLFVHDDLSPESEAPCRCYDAETGELLWETSLPTGPQALTGGAVWSGDDREVLVGVQRGGVGGLLVLGGDDGALRSRVTLGDILPYPLDAPGDAIMVRAEGLLLAIRLL